MKRTIKNLDVDIVGGQGDLTVQEGNAISAYLMRQKLLRINSVKVKTTSARKNKTLA